MRVLIKSFFAGVLISMGCVVYLMCSNKIVGSFLFSFGLFAILNFSLDLFTGKIGYLVRNRNWGYVKDLGITLTGNFVGTFLTATLIKLTRLDINDLVTSITEIKLNDSYVSMFILAIFCGMLMFLGVDLFKTIDSYIGKTISVIFAVMIFILSGFEHCIADMFYFNLAGNLNLPVLCVVIFGNTIGGLLLCEMSNIVKEKESVGSITR